MQVKRLLVATDLSERSDRAVDRAISLARKFQSSLTVLHVVEGDLPPSIADAQRNASLRNLEEHIASIPPSADLDIELSVVFGKDWSEILRQAETSRSDLIVLGLHREVGLEGLFRGTTVERVIRKGDLPVLVVKNRAMRDYKNIVVGMDFSLNSRRAIEFALDLTLTSSLCLVHAYDLPYRAFLMGSSDTEPSVSNRDEQRFFDMVNQEMDGCLSGLESSSIKLTKVMREGSPHDVLRKQVLESGADLLVLGTHGRTGVAHALLGSVAEGFLIDPPCDVLAVKAW